MVVLFVHDGLLHKVCVTDNTTETTMYVHDNYLYRAIRVILTTSNDEEGVNQKELDVVP